jgi:hypothetical protein
MRGEDEVAQIEAFRSPRNAETPLATVRQSLERFDRVAKATKLGR